MAAPTRVGATTYQNTGTGQVPMNNPSGAAAGDVLVAVLTVPVTTTSISNLAGWTLLADNSYNTRRTFVLTKAYAASHGNITLSANAATGVTVVAIRANGGMTLSAPVIGTRWDRPSNGGSITTTQHPSMTVAADTLALAFTAETSTGAETEAQVSLSGTGWTKWYYGDTDAAQAAAVNYFAAYREMTSAGATGTPTTTWPNASNNSVGFQVAITQTGGAPITTGQVGAHGCFNFGEESFVVGHDKIGGTVHEAVLYDATGTTELDRITTSHDATTGWGHADFQGLAPGTTYLVRYEVDGAEQTDAQVSVTTLDQSVTNFVALAGSCQFTGSNHPTFDRMRETGAAFLAHMGDLHYADATDEPGWRAGMESSLTTSRMKAMLEEIPMSWAPDNHDIIRTTPAGGGSSVTQTEWKQLRGTDGASADSLGWAWQHGRVLFIHTDMRSARDNYNSVAEPRTFLGAAQKAWLKAIWGAAETNPDIALVVWFTTWTARNDESGRWGSYDMESDELEAEVNSRPALKAKLVMVGGDSHVLQADSGARTGSVFRFHGVPSLNMSGFNRSSNYATGGWDIAEADLRTSGQPEADWGGYSRMTFDDNGGAGLVFTWEAVRVNASGVEDVMATWTNTYAEDPPSTGSASLGFSFGASATGKRTPKGSSSLGMVFGVAATGKRKPKGGGTLAYSFTVGATGKRKPKGSSALGYAFGVSAAGTTEKSGSAVLGYSLSLGATGTRQSRGVAGLAHAWTLGATGGSPSGGSAALGFSFGLAATGKRKPKGGATAGHAWAVTAAGDAPVVPGSGGSAEFDFTLGLSAVGERDSRGSATLGLFVDLAAAGQRKPKGGAGLGFTFDVEASGTVPGIDPNEGGATVGYALGVGATGQRKPLGTAALYLEFQVAAQGPVSNVDLPDVLTASVVPDTLFACFAALGGDMTCDQTITEKRGDTRTREIILARDLTGVSASDIKVFVSRRGIIWDIMSVTITDIVNGVIAITFEGQLDSGSYKMEVQVRQGSNVSTHPTEGWLTLHVVDDLGD